MRETTQPRNSATVYTERPSGRDEAAGTATSYALERYLPEQPVERKGVALCLSGGGYRAALFHLGALRRLNELGVLSAVDIVSSTSGGSITAALLCERLRPWPEPGSTVEDWESRIARPLRNFTRHNIRTLPIAKSLLPWHWRRSDTAVMALTERYQRSLVQGRLSHLPTHPRYIFSATDMTFGDNWLVERTRMGDSSAGFASPPPDWPIARAVAAASCFPPFFGPMKVNASPQILAGGQEIGPRRDELVRSIQLTDGGVYDNMALEPVWQDAATVLVSDGGATFDFESDRGLIWRLLRYVSIVGDQARLVRKRWLISNLILGQIQGTYWGIGSAVQHYAESEAAAGTGYSPDLVERVIAEIRTDLDAFSVAEIAVLENHGYLLTDAAIQRHAAQLIAVASPAQVPHPEWLDEARVASALANSHKRRFLGRW